MTIDRAGLEQRYNAVKASLPSNVKLIAVSKTRTVEEIQALYDLGHRAFGENYPQEVRDKQALLPADIEWHFIGHLQSSNIGYHAQNRFFTLIRHILQSNQAFTQNAIFATHRNLTLYIL